MIVVQFRPDESRTDGQSGQTYANERCKLLTDRQAENHSCDESFYLIVLKQALISSLS